VYKLNMGDGQNSRRMRIYKAGCGEPQEYRIDGTKATLTGVNKRRWVSMLDRASRKVSWVFFDCRVRLSRKKRKQEQLTTLVGKLRLAAQPCSLSTRLGSIGGVMARPGSSHAII